MGHATMSGDLELSVVGAGWKFESTIKIGSVCKNDSQMQDRYGLLQHIFPLLRLQSSGRRRASGQPSVLRDVAWATKSWRKQAHLA